MVVNNIPQDPPDPLLLPCEVTVHVLVQLAEEVGDPGLLVVVVLEEAFSPLLPVEMLDLLQLLEISQFVLESTIALPGHHPNVTPFVPESLGPRVLDAMISTHTGSAKS